MSIGRLGAAALLLGLTAAPPLARSAPSVSVAAASNLVYALDALHAKFKRAAPEIALTSTTGASGSLFAQIKNGAPFDVFLSADTEYPRLIVEQKLGDAATFRTFATGRLVLWTTRENLDVSDLVAIVRSPAVHKIALAQPRSAPYGRTAQAALEKLGVWHEAQPKLVLGENISQTAQFVESGNAEAGFVAMSLVLSPRLLRKGRWQEVPTTLYPAGALDHAVVLTQRGAANPAARRYLEFLATEPARRILRDFGYHVPP